ncbi:MAG: ribosome biogenesis GTPase Der [Planctomycetes bacterium]|nr:ribosome biogenesis GTPase Der [Planctomycetota bacterium]
MSLPIVAIVGRPNVGKSSLLNCVAKRRISIVEPTPGVTRDRVSADVVHDGVTFELVDTGGIGIVDSDKLEAQVETQIRFALDLADVVIFLVDVRAGVTPLDREIAGLLRKLQKSVVLAANKADVTSLEAAAVEFFQLGFGEPIAISALEHINTTTLLDEVVRRIPEEKRQPAPASEMKLAIVGRRNAGKSTLINAIVGEERMIVSEVPGTTRDSVDVRVARKGKSFVVIDTAGMRKRARVQDSIDFYGQSRTMASISRADVVVLLLDATDDIGEVDKKIGATVRLEAKPCVIGVNKWDLAGHVTPEEFQPYVRDHLRGLDFVPIVHLSALKKSRVQALVDAAFKVHRQANERVTTGKLNRVIEAAERVRRPQARRGVLPKLFYATQTDVNPPKMLLFVNDPALFTKEYERYLENVFRRDLPFSSVPVKIVFRKRPKVILGEPR